MARSPDERRAAVGTLRAALPTVVAASALPYGYDLLATETLGPIKPINRYQDRVLAGLFDWIAVGTALGAVSLLDDIHGWLPWLVGPLAAAALYLLIASVQLAVVVARER